MQSIAAGDGLMKRALDAADGMVEDFVYASLLACDEYRYVSAYYLLSKNLTQPSQDRLAGGDRERRRSRRSCAVQDRQFLRCHTPKRAEASSSHAYQTTQL